MKTNKLATVTVLVVTLFSGAATAKSKAKCERDAKDFIRMCQHTCDQQLAKKNPKAGDACKKSCQTQTAKFEKECDRAK